MYLGSVIFIQIKNLYLQQNIKCINSGSSQTTSWKMYNETTKNISNKFFGIYVCTQNAARIENLPINYHKLP